HHAVALERLGRGEPDELDAFLLGMENLALRARHVLAVAAVEAAHRARALANRRAHAIHRRVAAADDHDVLAGGVERAAVESRQRVAQALAVRRRQILHRGYDIAETDAGTGHVARLVDAG